MHERAVRKVRWSGRLLALLGRLELLRPAIPFKFRFAALPTCSVCQILMPYLVGGILAFNTRHQERLFVTSRRGFARSKLARRHLAGEAPTQVQYQVATLLLSLYLRPTPVCS
jgi:hypothetical protein